MLALIALTASAADLQWTWDADTRRTWYVESAQTLGGVQHWYVANQHVRIVQTQLRMITTCEVERETKRRWELSCVIDDASVVASSMPGEEARVPAATAWMDQKLEGATFEVRLGRDGRIGLVDLEAEQSWDPDERAMDAAIEAMVKDAFHGFDLELGEGERWTQEYARLAEWQGTAGRVPVTHELVGVEDGKAVVHSAGQGHLSAHWLGDLEADAVWDLAAGAPSYRWWKVISTSHDGTKVYPWIHTGVIQELQPGHQVSVGRSGEWDDAFEMTQAVGILTMALHEHQSQ